MEVRWPSDAVERVDPAHQVFERLVVEVLMPLVADLAEDDRVLALAQLRLALQYRRLERVLLADGEVERQRLVGDAFLGVAGEGRSRGRHAAEQLPLVE